MQEVHIPRVSGQRYEESAMHDEVNTDIKSNLELPADALVNLLNLLNLNLLNVALPPKFMHLYCS
jgi:hypothetical protein